MSEQEGEPGSRCGGHGGSHVAVALGVDGGRHTDGGAGAELGGRVAEARDRGAYVPVAGIVALGVGHLFGADKADDQHARQIDQEYHDIDYFISHHSSSFFFSLMM